MTEAIIIKPGGRGSKLLKKGRSAMKSLTRIILLVAVALMMLSLSGVTPAVAVQGQEDDISFPFLCYSINAELR